MGFGGKDPITRRDLLRGAVTGMIALAAGVVPNPVLTMRATRRPTRSAASAGNRSSRLSA